MDTSACTVVGVITRSGEIILIKQIVALLKTRVHSSGRSLFLAGVIVLVVGVGTVLHRAQHEMNAPEGMIKDWLAGAASCLSFR